MQKDYLLVVNEFCTKHNIENSFIISLEKIGLIKVKTIRQDLYIDAEQLRQLEKIVHFYYELHINLEGIETITHLLTQLRSLQDENTVLRNRVRLYE